MSNPYEPTQGGQDSTPYPSQDQAFQGGPAAYQQTGYAEQAYQGQGYQGQPYPAQGYPASYPAYYDPMAKSQLAAGLLGIFLGSLGIHRFYLGYVGIGILQIFVTIVTFGIGGLWGFIEGIMILAGAQSFRVDATGRPLRQ